MPVSDGALRAGLELAMGRQVEVLERSPLADESTFPIERVEVVVDGERLTMVFKDSSPTSAPDAPAQSKPAFVRDPRREIVAYRGVLASAAIDAPRCYGSISDADGERFWLFLEHVDGELLWRIGDFTVWEQAARWLANLHGQEVRQEEVGLLRYDAEWFRTWLPRAVDATEGAALVRLTARWERVVERLGEWPVSFVHGEFYPSNVLVQRGEEKARLRPVDWEMAGFGPGLLDLAALTGGGWTEDQRGRLVAAYFDAWGEHTPRPDWHVFAEVLDCCRLHLAVQWIGWSPGWSPPSEHAHDWRAEALELADRLGL